jgi:hypothetical protein
MLKYSILISWILIIASCSGNTNSKEEKCRFGEPTSIFNEQNPAIASSNFKKEGRIGIETIQFKNQLSLELTQSGCQNLVQDFAFSLPMTNPKADGQFWIQQGEQLMRFLGNTDPSLMQFGEWANMIAQSSKEMKLGEAKEIQTGYFVTVDKISGKEQTIIKVTLEGR